MENEPPYSSASSTIRPPVKPRPVSLVHSPDSAVKPIKPPVKARPQSMKSPNVTSPIGNVISPTDGTSKPPVAQKPKLPTKPKPVTTHTKPYDTDKELHVVTVDSDHDIYAVINKNPSPRAQQLQSDDTKLSSQHSSHDSTTISDHRSVGTALSPNTKHKAVPEDSDNTSQPVPSPARPEHPKLPTKPPTDQHSTLPASADEPSKPAINRSRPKSIKVTEDESHSQVAEQLSSILGRPRSSSKGLLSPTSYSAPTHTVTASTDNNNITPEQLLKSATPVSPDRPTGPPRPVPRTRQKKANKDNSVLVTAAISDGRKTDDECRSLSVRDSSPTTASNIEMRSGVTDNPEPKSSPTTQTSTPPTRPSEKPKRPPPPSRPPPPAVKKPVRPPQASPTAPNTASKEASPVENVSDKQGSTAHDTSIKRKLEITVLGARPMSEVGFRDSVSVSQSTAKDNTVPVKQKIHSPKIQKKLSPSSPHHQYDRLENQTEAEKLDSTRQDVQLDSAISITANSTAETKVAMNTSVRKPTIIRPGRQNTSDMKDTDNLVRKEGVNSQKAKPTIIRPAQSPKSGGASKTPSRPPAIALATTTASPSTTRKDPPNSLQVKKDPWNQIAKGPGPTDNLAFTSGDTPPPKPGLPPLPLIYNKYNSSNRSAKDNARNLIDHQSTESSTTALCNNQDAIIPNQTKPTKTLMDQSIENNFPVIELQPDKRTDRHGEVGSEESDDITSSAGYFHMSETRESTVSKPSALQRIYAQKAKREEENPDKYKHRLDCYIDKENDKSFWKPGESEELSTPNHKSNNKKDGGAVATCRALYDFTGETSDDLSFTQGDIIEVMEYLDDQWCRGEIQGRQGTFPVAYVEVMDSEVQVPDSPYSLQAFCAFDFVSTESSDLPLKAGQEVKVTAKVDSEWLYGEVSGGRKGLFPSLFVSVGEDDIEMLPLHVPSDTDTQTEKPPNSDIAALISSSNLKTGTVLYNFDAESNLELSLQVGSNVILLGEVDGEWSRGQCGDKTGIFPTSFVEPNKL